MRNFFLVTILGIIALLTILFLTSPAFAHNSGYNPDRDGDGRVEVFKGTSVGNLHGGWHDYMVKANRQMRERIPQAPRLTRVYDRNRADVVMIRKIDWSNCSGQYNESAFPDEIRIGGSCKPGPKWFSHEMGHGYGELHHDCTAFWKKRTASVAGLNDITGKLESGCKVEVNGFGLHDIRHMQNRPWNDPTATFSASSMSGVYDEREQILVDKSR